MKPAELLREDATQLRRWGRNGSLHPDTAEAMAKRVEACADLMEHSESVAKLTGYLEGSECDFHDIGHVQLFVSALKRVQEVCDE